MGGKTVSVNFRLGAAWPDTVPLFARLSALIAAFHVIAFFAFAPGAQVLLPYSDMFDLLDVYFHAEATGDWLGYLLQPHSYHRIPVLRSLIALDVGVFKGTGIPFLVSAIVCVGWTAVLLARQALATPVRALRIPAAALTLAILLSTDNVVHVSVPANTPYPQALFFAVLAIALAEPAYGATRRALTWRRAGALAAAGVAVLSLAAGAVVWPVLAFMAWRKGAPDRAWLLLLLAAGGAFFAAYVHGLTLENSAGTLTAESLIKGADYFFNFLGLPWARATPEGGRIIGAAMFGLSLLAIVRNGGPEASRHERIAVAMVLFSLGVAVLAAVGRQNITEAVLVPGRYNLLLTPMKVGLILLALPWLGRRLAAHQRTVETGVVAIFALFLTQQVMVGRIVVASAEHLRETITDFQLGVRTEEMKTLIHPNLDRAHDLQARIHDRGLYAHLYAVALQQRANTAER